MDTFWLVLGIIMMLVGILGSILPLLPGPPLAYLAFEVNNIEEAVRWLEANGVVVEPIRRDEYTGKQFTFFSDPDALPLEFYER